MYERHVLDNGLRLLTASMPHTRSVSVCFFVGVGSRYESEKQAGLSHFVEHVCFKGTKRRSTSREISETIDSVGGVLNGGTDKELTVYWAKVGRQHLELALDLLSDMLRQSRVEPVDVERERKVIIEELNMCFDLPQSRVELLIDEVLWPGQPLGRDVAGNRETVSSFDRQAILDYMTAHYSPNNTVVSIAGDLTQDESVHMVERCLGDWRSRDGQTWVAADGHQTESRLFVERRNTEQAHMCLAVHGVDAHHPKRFSLEVMNVLLGEGMSSRLFMEIRERRGLAYEVQSHVSYFHDSGALTVYAGIDPANVEATVEAVLHELVRLRDEPVSEGELNKAKELGKGRLMLRMEDTRNVSGWLGGQELLTCRVRTVDEVLSLIDGVTPGDLQAMARDLVRSDGLNLAVVGPVPGEGRLKDLLSV